MYEFHEGDRGERRSLYKRDLTTSDGEMHLKIKSTTK